MTDTLSDYTIADGQALNALKNAIRQVTCQVDQLEKTYPPTIEAQQIAHEIEVLLVELNVHGLFPNSITLGKPVSVPGQWQDTTLVAIKQSGNEEHYRVIELPARSKNILMKKGFPTYKQAGNYIRRQYVSEVLLVEVADIEVEQYFRLLASVKWKAENL